MNLKQFPVLLKHELSSGVAVIFLIPVAVLAVVLMMDKTTLFVLDGGFFTLLMLLLVNHVGVFAHREYCAVLTVEYEKYLGGLEFAFSHAIDRKTWLLAKNVLFFGSFLAASALLAAYHYLSGNFILTPAARMALANFIVIGWFGVLLVQWLIFLTRGRVWAVSVILMILAPLVLLPIWMLAPDGAIGGFLLRYMGFIMAILLALTAMVHRYSVEHFCEKEVY